MRRKSDVNYVAKTKIGKRIIFPLFLIQDVKGLFQVSLQWKFECLNCLRFSVMSMQDYVLRLDGSKPGSLEELLDKYLHKKVCRLAATRFPI